MIFGFSRKKRELVDDIPSDERPEAAEQGSKPDPVRERAEDAPAAFGGAPEGSSGAEGYGKRGAPSAEQSASAPEQEPREEGAEPEDDYDLDAGLSDFYTRLRNRLRSYGITSIPAFSELYGLFESFLRPAIDAAINARVRRGRSNMAELDADAYARGMGGSSYITSMKAREQDDVDSDISGLEGQYAASMSEYFYKALSAMQELEADMQKTRMNIASQQAMLNARLNAQGGSGGGSGRSGSGSRPKAWGHNKNGAYFDGKWYDGDFSYLSSGAGYNDYEAYLKGLSPAERYLFFTSDQRAWRMRRWQVQYNMTEIDYMDLYSAYMPKGGRPGLTPPKGGGGPKWPNMLY